MNSKANLFHIQDDCVSVSLEKLFAYEKLNFIEIKHKSFSDLILMKTTAIDFDKEKFLKKKNKHIQSMIVYFIKEKKKCDQD